MGKALDVSVQDGALDKFALATELYLVTAHPVFGGSGRANAIALALNSAVTLAGSDFTKATGDVSGRKVTYGAKSVPITVAGTAVEVAFCTSSTLLGTTTITSTAVNAGDTVNLSSSKLEVGDPT